MTDQTTRPLYVIAREIRQLWAEPFFGAVPYIDAMGSLDHVSDSFGADPGKDVVVYFLSNAKTWKGEDAARIKNELRRAIGQKEVKARASKAADKPADDEAKAQRKADAAIVKAAVMRAIFCPYTGNVLDMRRAVVVVTPGGSKVMAAAKWDEIKDQFLASVRRTLGDDGLATVKVLDGRELFTPAGRVR